MHERPRAVTSNVPPSSGIPIQTRLGRPSNKEFDNGWGVLGPRQLFYEARLRIEIDPTSGRVLAPLPICWKEARTDVPSGPGNADLSQEGLARIGGSNGDCTDEKRLEWELVSASSAGQECPSRRILDGASMGLENPIEACFRWIFDGPSMTVRRGSRLGSSSLMIRCS